MKISNWFDKLDFETNYFWKWLHYKILKLFSWDFKVFVGKSDIFIRWWVYFCKLGFSQATVQKGCWMMVLMASNPWLIVEQLGRHGFEGFDGVASGIIVKLLFPAPVWSLCSSDFQVPRTTSCMWRGQMLDSPTLLITVVENHRKSLIQYCERSELRLHFE